MVRVIEGRVYDLKVLNTQDKRRGLKTIIRKINRSCLKVGEFIIEKDFQILTLMIDSAYWYVPLHMNIGTQ